VAETKVRSEKKKITFHQKMQMRFNSLGRADIIHFS
jgi:hypothetical protein